jgi:hypothetical protein
MPRAFNITRSRFTARTAAPAGNFTATWESERHELLYPAPYRPVGSDRAVDVTVNGFLRMTFNKPIPAGENLLLYGGLVTAYANGGGVVSAPTEIDISFSAPKPQALVYTICPNAAQVVNFPAFQTRANLGQVAFLRVTLQWGKNWGVDNPLDVTFQGAILSSDPLLGSSDFIG